MASTKPQTEYEHFVYDRYLEAYRATYDPNRSLGMLTGLTIKAGLVKQSKGDVAQLRYVLQPYEETGLDEGVSETGPDWAQKKFIADMFNYLGDKPAVKAYFKDTDIIQPNTPWPKIVAVLDLLIKKAEKVGEDIKKSNRFKDQSADDLIKTFGLDGNFSHQEIRDNLNAYCKTTIDFHRLKLGLKVIRDTLRNQAELEKLNALHIFFSGSKEDQSRYNNTLAVFYALRPERVYTFPETVQSTYITIKGNLTFGNTNVEVFRRASEHQQTFHAVPAPVRLQRPRRFI